MEGREGRFTLSKEGEEEEMFLKAKGEIGVGVPTRRRRRGGRAGEELMDMSDEEAEEEEEEEEGMEVSGLVGVWVGGWACLFNCLISLTHFPPSLPPSLRPSFTLVNGHPPFTTFSLPSLCILLLPPTPPAQPTNSLLGRLSKEGGREGGRGG